MTKSKDLRDVVIAHYQNGKNAIEISIILAIKVHLVTVHRGDLTKVIRLTDLNDPEDDVLGELED